MDKNSINQAKVIYPYSKTPRKNDHIYRKRTERCLN